jgi:hypothetical protein
MLRVIKILFVTIFFSNPLISQSKKTSMVKPPVGLYFGGISYSNETMAIGYYYFKQDSSFIFVSTTSKSNVLKENLKNSFADTIGGYGKGKWFIKDSFFVIKFDAVKNYSLHNDEVVYHCFSERPFDSVIIKVNLTDKMYGKPLPGAVTIKELNRFIVTDTLGYGEIKFPFSYGEYKVTVSHPDYHDKTIVLNPANNIHELKIALEKKEMSCLKVVKAFSYPIKLRVNENGDIDLFNLKRENAGIEKLLQVIKNGYNKMPEQKYFLDKIMNEIKE